MQTYKLGIPEVNSPEYTKEGYTLIQVLKYDKDPVEWEISAHKLGKLRYKPAVEPLIELLRGDGMYESRKHDFAGREARGAAALALGKIGGETAIKELERLIDNYDSQNEKFCVVGYAVLAYGEANGISAVEKLIQLLDSKYWEINISAIQSLGEIGDARAIEPLTHKLNDDRDHIEQYAREALNEINKRIKLNKNGQKIRNLSN